MSRLTPIGALTLLAVASLTIMVGCVIVPGLPTISQQLGVPAAAGWLVTLPSLGVVLFGPLAGKMMSRVGLRRALMLGLFLYGALGCTGMWLSGVLLVFSDRLLLGGATALVMASGTGLISMFYLGEQRLKMMAWQGMSIELGGVLFLFVAGLLAVAHWQLPFLLYLSAWLLLVMVVLCVPEPEEPAQDDNPTIQTSQPARPLRRVYALALLSMVCFFTVVIVFPLRFHDAGYNEAQTGYFLSLVSLVAVLAAWQMPRVVAKRGAVQALMLAFTAYLLAHLLFALGSSLTVWLMGGLFCGIGFGLSVPLVNHLTVEFSPAALRGRHLARLSMAIFSGQFLASFLLFIPGDHSHMFFAAALIAAFSVPITLTSG